MKFSGIIPAKLDAKGRVFFPSAFRKHLDVASKEFVLRRDIFQPCLVIYPLNVWEAEVEMLSARLSRWDRNEAMYLRQFLADAETVSLDANGRFLVSKRLLELAGIKHEAVFVGSDDRVELWSKERTSAPFVSDESFAEGIENAMSAHL